MDTRTSHAEDLGINEATLSSRLAFFRIDADDLRRLEELRPFAVQVTDGIVAQFYDHLLHQPETREFLRDPELVARLKRKQTAYFLELFAGRVDLPYVENRLQVGTVHARLGVHPRWYIGAFSLYLDLVHRELLARGGSAEQIQADFESVERMMQFDASLAIDAYVAGHLEAQQREQIARTEGLRRLGQMAAVVAHEVKNPLASIGGVVQILQGRATADGDRNILGRVLDRLRELDRLLDELLQFARPRGPSLAPVALGPLVHEVVASIRHDPATRDVSVSVDRCEATVPADRAMIHRLLLNLLINAAQAMDGKGTISLDCAGHGRFLELRVTDTGPGVPEELREQIFEPFYTSKARGSGLGLAIARWAAEAHGGTLGVERAPTGGARFVLRLPSGQDD